MDAYDKNRVNPCNPCLKKVDAYFDTSTFFYMFVSKLRL